ncbi:MAG: EutN/CcmL family microcompartment protein [bacterium]
MILGRVSGAIHSTINHPFYDGKRLLIVDRINPDGTDTGKYLIAIDSVDAGTGETVLVIDEGNSARQIVDDSTAPLRSIIIGIVDSVE